MSIETELFDTANIDPDDVPTTQTPKKINITLSIGTPVSVSEKSSTKLSSPVPVPRKILNPPTPSQEPFRPAEPNGEVEVSIILLKCFFYFACGIEVHMTDQIVKPHTPS